MIGKLTCFLSLLLALAQDGKLEKTPYDKWWKRECPDNEHFSYIKSRHENIREDRTWELTCTPSGVTLTNCKWSGYQNGFDRLLNYNCENGVINGIESVHENYYEDRKWSMYCCKMDRAPKACFQTAQLNWYDKLLSVSITPEYFLSGVWSTHDNYYEDRIWKFTICRF